VARACAAFESQYAKHSFSLLPQHGDLTGQPVLRLFGCMCSGTQQVDGFTNTGSECSSDGWEGFVAGIGLPGEFEGVTEDASCEDVVSEIAPPIASPLLAHGANLYALLGVTLDATASEIRAAYRKLALVTHPDKPGGDTATFQRVVAAFEVLSDAASRQRYDSQLQSGATQGAPCVGSNVKPQQQGQQSVRKRASCRKVCSFEMRLSDILRKMTLACRRQVISERLTEAQRLALEAHLNAKKASSQRAPVGKLRLRNCGKRAAAKAELATSPNEEESPTSLRADCKHVGINKQGNSGKVYGYYARVCVHGFGLLGNVHKELIDAVGDHIFLQRVAEGIRCGAKSCPFSACVQRALSDAREEIGWVEDIIAGVEVYLSYHHFIGGHSFKLKFASLTEGTTAWEQLHAAKGQDLFRGASVTEAYTPRAAKEQWHRLKSTFLELAASINDGRNQTVRREEKIRTRLQHLEDSYSQSRYKRESILWKQSKLSLNRAGSGTPSSFSRTEEDRDAILLQRLNRLLRTQAGLPRLKKIPTSTSEKKARKKEKKLAKEKKKKKKKEKKKRRRSAVEAKKPSGSSHGGHSQSQHPQVQKMHRQSSQGSHSQCKDGQHASDLPLASAAL